MDITHAQLRTARQCQDRFGVWFPLIEGDAGEVPLAGASFDLAVSECGASLYCDPGRWIPEAARLLRPGGRLVFHTLSVLVVMCQREGGPAGRELLRPQREVSRLAGGRGVEFHPGHGEWIDVLRGAGLVIGGLHELYAPPGAADHRYYQLATASWSQRWPVEEIWVACRPAALAAGHAWRAEGAMTIEPPDFASRVSQAIKSYEASWKPVDGELYELCRRRPSHDVFADVYTKVAIIGRVYEAGVARAWRGKGDPETEVTRALIEHAEHIRNGLQGLENRPFNRQAAADIVELHGHVARAISHRTDGVFLTSFVSKYLHFHCPIVPIFDSNAQSAIGQLVDWKLASAIREAMTDLPEWARAYRNFAAAFVVLYERAYAQKPLKPTVKELDHLLWQPR